LICRIWSPRSWISSRVASMLSIFISCGVGGREAGGQGTLLGRTPRGDGRS
jgi:hypothetical protein